MKCPNVNLNNTRIELRRHFKIQHLNCVNNLTLAHSVVAGLAGQLIANFPKRANKASIIS